MKKLIFITIMLLLTVQVYAELGCARQIKSISGLSEEIKQGMIVSCEKAKLESTKKVLNIDSINIKDLTKWGQVAKQFAEAIGIAAAELGIAVNDFIKTPAGIMVIAGIFWTIAGASLLSFVVGIVLEILIIIFCYCFVKYIVSSKTDYKYEYKPILWGLHNKKCIVEKITESWGDFEYSMVIIVPLVGVLLTWVITANLLLL